ncbi:hypothetical protein PQR65_12525 [Paraburkholderia nemoris]|uniref:hypothetical protein n=1 Tax=Paraburkholderia nemoris TaxID=2793076 RepID=UPI0038BD2220
MKNLKKKMLISWAHKRRVLEAIKADWWALFVAIFILGLVLLFLYMFRNLRSNISQWLAISGSIVILMGSMISGLMLRPSISEANEEEDKLRMLQEDMAKNNAAINVQLLYGYIYDLVEMNKKNAVERRTAAISSMVFFLISMMVMVVGTALIGLGVV